MSHCDSKSLRLRRKTSKKPESSMVTECFTVSELQSWTSARLKKIKSIIALVFSYTLQNLILASKIILSLEIPFCTYIDSLTCGSQPQYVDTHGRLSAVETPGPSSGVLATLLLEGSSLRITCIIFFFGSEAKELPGTESFSVFFFIKPKISFPNTSNVPFA